MVDLGPWYEIEEGVDTTGEKTLRNDEYDERDENLDQPLEKTHLALCLGGRLLIERRAGVFIVIITTRCARSGGLGVLSAQSLCVDRPRKT